MAPKDSRSWGKKSLRGAKDHFKELFNREEPPPLPERSGPERFLKDRPQSAEPPSPSQKLLDTLAVAGRKVGEITSRKSTPSRSATPKKGDADIDFCDGLSTQAVRGSARARQSSPLGQLELRSERRFGSEFDDQMVDRKILESKRDSVIEDERQQQDMVVKRLPIADSQTAKKAAITPTSPSPATPSRSEYQKMRKEVLSNGVSPPTAKLLLSIQEGNIADVFGEAAISEAAKQDAEALVALTNEKLYINDSDPPLYPALIQPSQARYYVRNSVEEFMFGPWDGNKMSLYVQNKAIRANTLICRADYGQEPQDWKFWPLSEWKKCYPAGYNFFKFPYLGCLDGEGVAAAAAEAAEAKKKRQQEVVDKQKKVKEANDRNTAKESAKKELQRQMDAALERAMKEYDGAEDGKKAAALQANLTLPLGGETVTETLAKNKVDQKTEMTKSAEQAEAYVRKFFLSVLSPENSTKAGESIRSVNQRLAPKMQEYIDELEGREAERAMLGCELPAAQEADKRAELNPWDSGDMVSTVPKIPEGYLFTKAAAKAAEEAAKGTAQGADPLSSSENPTTVSDNIEGQENFAADIPTAELPNPKPEPGPQPQPEPEPEPQPSHRETMRSTSFTSVETVKPSEEHQEKEHAEETEEEEFSQCACFEIQSELSDDSDSFVNIYRHPKKTFPPTYHRQYFFDDVKAPFKSSGPLPGANESDHPNRSSSQGSEEIKTEDEKIIDGAHALLQAASGADANPIEREWSLRGSSSSSTESSGLPTAGPAPAKVNGRYLTREAWIYQARVQAGAENFQEMYIDRVPEPRPEPLPLSQEYVHEDWWEHVQEANRRLGFHF